MLPRDPMRWRVNSDLVVDVGNSVPATPSKTRKVWTTSKPSKSLGVGGGPPKPLLDYQHGSGKGSVPDPDEFLSSGDHSLVQIGSNDGSLHDG